MDIDGEEGVYPTNTTTSRGIVDGTTRRGQIGTTRAGEMTEEALPETGTIREVTGGAMIDLMIAGTSLMAEDIKIAIARGKTTDKITADWAVMVA